MRLFEQKKRSGQEEKEGVMMVVNSKQMLNMLVRK